MKTKTVIIGGGISGLSIGHYLNKINSDFLIIEKNNRLGGNIFSENINGFICENGPNTILLNNIEIKELIEDINLSKDIYWPNEKVIKNRYVLKNNILKRLPSSLLDFLSTDLISIKDKVSIFKEPFISKHKKDTSISNFFKKRFGNGIYTNFVLPFITGIYAGNPEIISVKYGLNKIWELEQSYGSILKGLILKKRKKEKNMIFSFRNGLSDLINGIAKPIFNKIKTNTRIKKINYNENSYYIYTEKEIIECEKIICTIPAFDIADLINNNELKNELLNINYLPVDIIHLGFKKNTIKNKDMGYGILTKPSDKKSFLGVLFSSRIFPHTSPKDQELFTVIIGGDRQKELCNLEENKLQKIIIEEIKEMLKINSTPSFIKHFKWKKGIPQYDLKHNKLLNCIKKFNLNNPNFHLLSNYTNGISVSDCVKKAKKIVDKLYL